MFMKIMVGLNVLLAAGALILIVVVLYRHIEQWLKIIENLF